MELKAKCVSEVDSVQNSIAVLSDMLTNYSEGKTSQDEIALINELYDCCERFRPRLFRLAGELYETDPELDSILNSNDDLTKIINEYKRKMNIPIPNNLANKPQTKTKSNSNALLDLGDIQIPTHSNEDVSLLSDHILDLSIDSSDSSQVISASSGKSDEVNVEISLSNATTSRSCLSELEADLWKRMTGEEKPEVPNEKLPLNELQRKKTSLTSETNTSIPNSNSGETLAKLFLPLGSIKPSTANPHQLMDKDGLKVVLNLAKNSPRSDVTVLVLSIISTNKCEISGIKFQAAVPKNMKIKLQPASGNVLPSFSSFVPPSAITQVMLIGKNSDNETNRVKFKYKLNYIINEKNETEAGEIDHLYVTD